MVRFSSVRKAYPGVRIAVWTTRLRVGNLGIKHLRSFQMEEIDMTENRSRARRWCKVLVVLIVLAVVWRRLHLAPDPGNGETPGPEGTDHGSRSPSRAESAVVPDEKMSVVSPSTRAKTATSGRRGASSASWTVYRGIEAPAG